MINQGKIYTIGRVSEQHYNFIVLFSVCGVGKDDEKARVKLAEEEYRRNNGPT